MKKISLKLLIAFLTAILTGLVREEHVWALLRSPDSVFGEWKTKTYITLPVRSFLRSYFWNSDNPVFVIDPGKTLKSLVIWNQRYGETYRSTGDLQIANGKPLYHASKEQGKSSIVWGDEEEVLKGSIKKLIFFKNFPLSILNLNSEDPDEDSIYCGWGYMSAYKLGPHHITEFSHWWKDYGDRTESDFAFITDKNEVYKNDKLIAQSDSKIFRLNVSHGKCYYIQFVSEAVYNLFCDGKFIAQLDVVIGNPGKYRMIDGKPYYKDFDGVYFWGEERIGKNISNFQIIGGKPFFVKQSEEKKWVVWGGQFGLVVDEIFGISVVDDKPLFIQTKIDDNSSKMYWGWNCILSEKYSDDFHFPMIIKGWGYGVIQKNGLKCLVDVQRVYAKVTKILAVCRVGDDTYYTAKVMDSGQLVNTLYKNKKRIRDGEFRDLQERNGELLYIFIDDNKESVVYGDMESKKYDEIFGLHGDNDKIIFYARKKRNIFRVELDI